MRTALTIAGSDSGGGAGIQADLKTFAAFRVYGTTAITAITAQNTERVHDVLTLPPAQVVTPNRPEAEALARMPIANWEDARTAARKIHALGPKAVIVKGGHFEGPMLTNLLFDGN